MNYLKSFKFLLGFLFSLAALYLAFRNVPFTELVTYFQNIRYSYLPLAVFFCAIGFFLRALRWQILLSYQAKPSFFSAYHPMIIGFMLNCILPGRVGELARPAIFAKREGFSFPATLSTIVIERLFDLLILLALFFFVFNFIDIKNAGEYHFAQYTLSIESLVQIAKKMFFLSILLFFLISLIFIMAKEKRGVMIKKIISFFPCLPSFCKKKLSDFSIFIKEKILKQAKLGFSSLKNPYKSGFCLLISFSIWFIQVLAYWALAKASNDITGNFFHLTAIMVIVNFFIALPSVPGFWGIWEAGTIFALSLFGIQGSEASGFALLSHIFLMFPIIFMGLISVFLSGFNFSLKKDKFF